MKDKKEIKLIYKIIAAIVICAMVIALIICVFPEQKKISNTEKEESSSIETTKGNATEIPPEEEILEIDTPYCKMSYPAIWSDNLEYEEKTEGGVFSKTFYYSSDEHKVEMFTVYFGETEAGTALGYISKDGEKIPFSVKVNEHKTEDNWTEEEKELLSSMTDGVNEIIFSVTSNENFTKE